MLHLLAILGQTTTWYDQIQGFLENVSTQREFFILCLNLNAVSTCFVSGYFGYIVQAESIGIVAKWYK